MGLFMALRWYCNIILVLLLFSLSGIHSVDVLRDEAEILSVFQELSPHILGFDGAEGDLFRLRTQSDQTTNSLLYLINRRHDFVNTILSPDFNVYSSNDSSEWTYEAYLTLSVQFIISQGMELFDACYFKHNGKILHVCLMKVHRKLICQEMPSESAFHALLSGLKISTELINKPGNFRMIQGIVDSNCGRHHEAHQRAEEAVLGSPKDDIYRFILSELLSRKSKELLPQALEAVEVAIKLNSSKTEYHEKRLMLLMRMGRLPEAQEEASRIRRSVEVVLKKIYCPHCPVGARVKLPPTGNPMMPPASLLVNWRPWLVLGLYDLVSGNSSRAERELTISLDLASSASVFDSKMEVTDGVINKLLYLKAVAHLFAGNVKDAMDTAVKVVHSNPAALDATVFVTHMMARNSLYQRTVTMLDLVIRFLETLETSPGNATYVEVVTNVGLLKRVALQLRAWLQYRRGDLVSAEADAKECLTLLPKDALCSYVSTLCQLVSGRFVEAIHSAAPVLSRAADRRLASSTEFIYLSYLKEWARFLHAHLTNSVHGLQSLCGLPVTFLRAWMDAVSPLHSLMSYREQPGISVQHTWLIAPPTHLYSIISTVHPPNTTLPRCLAIEYLSSWRTEPLYCQQLHWLRLKSFVCTLDTEVRLVYSSTLLPNPETLGRRHRITLAIGALYAAETIRNFWCHRRRVSFTTCWAYAPSNQDDPNLRRPDAFERSVSKNQCLLLPRHHHQPFFNEHSKSSGDHRYADENIWAEPTWSYQLDLIANLLLLADPSETPPLWWLEGFGLGHHDSPLPSEHSDEEVRDDGDDDRQSMEDVDNATVYPDSEESQMQNNTNPRESIETNHDPGHDTDSIWHRGTVRERQCLVRQNKQALGSTEYIRSTVHLLYTSVRLHLRRGSTGCGSTYTMQDRVTLTVTKDSSEDNLGNFARQEELLSTLDKLWKEAVSLNLVVDSHVAGSEGKLVVNLYVPGRSGLRHLVSSDFDAYHHLVSVLLLNKDDRGTYDLCILRVSNAEVQRGLIRELDAAFADFLSQGEKALAAILTGTNAHRGPNRQTSMPIDDQYLRRAMQSAFYWFYYWIALKPLASSHSVHVGFSGLLAMLRSLGVEPGILPDTSWNLETQALLIGSPEAFAALCFKYLHPTWLSVSSLQLTWQIAPSALMRSPSDFIELLNLQAVDTC